MKFVRAFEKMKKLYGSRINQLFSLHCILFLSKLPFEEQSM